MSAKENVARMMRMKMTKKKVMVRSRVMSKIR